MCVYVYTINIYINNFRVLIDVSNTKVFSVKFLYFTNQMHLILNNLEDFLGYSLGDIGFNIQILILVRPVYKNIRNEIS